MVTIIQHIKYWKRIPSGNWNFESID